MRCRSHRRLWILRHARRQQHLLRLLLQLRFARHLSVGLFSHMSAVAARNAGGAALAGIQVLQCVPPQTRSVEVQTELHTRLPHAVSAFAQTAPCRLPPRTASTEAQTLNDWLQALVDEVNGSNARRFRAEAELHAARLPAIPANYGYRKR